MDIQVNVIHTLSPEVLDLLKVVLSSTPQSNTTSAPQKSEQVEKPVKKANGKKEVTKETVTEPVEESAEETLPEPVAEPEDNTTSDIQIEDIRKKATPIIKSGKENKEKVKAILDSFGVDSISSLAPNQYKSFMKKLDEIK